MTEAQWRQFIAVIEGDSDPAENIGAFIVDSPWLPGWAKVSTIDYYTSDEVFFEANERAINRFKELIFLPGFWAEFGMCTEPSAFGTPLIWSEENLPHADRIIFDPEDSDTLREVNVESDGLLPFVIARMKRLEGKVNAMGHAYRFAVARGPLNIASFLMGTTEFLMMLATEPERTGRLLRRLSDFICDWLRYQKKQFPSIDGIMVLDDIVGFIGEDDFLAYAAPYLEQCFTAFPATVRLFHNDAGGLVCAPHLAACNINVFNFSSNHPLQEMRDLVGEKVTLLGNLPPRDILSLGDEEAVFAATRSMLASIDDKRRILWSCGGGVPQGVSCRNMDAFIRALKM